MDWTGHEAAIWQEASRRTIVEFAKAVGVSPDAVERWRRHRGDRTPRKVTQRLLDADFAKADPHDKARFVRLLNSSSAPIARAVETTAAIAATNRPVKDSEDLSDITLTLGPRQLLDHLPETATDIEAARLQRNLDSARQHDTGAAPGRVATPQAITVTPIGSAFVPWHGHQADAAVGQLDSSARESLAFAEWARDDNSGGLTVDILADELARIAERFVHTPPHPLVIELGGLRDRIRHALALGQPPQRMRELLFLGAVTIELLAQITSNLGNPTAAMTHARAAEALATRAGHDGLRAWTIGTQALIAEWNADPHAALRILDRAHVVTSVGQHQIRLAALQARCAARLGHRDTVKTAVTRALTAADTAPAAEVDDVAAFGGSLVFPTSKLSYYLGTTYRLTGDHPRAQSWAQRAVDGYTSGPEHERSYGDEALARTDIALVRIAEGAFDGAHDILTPVFALPPAQHIQPIGEGLRAVAHATTGHTTPIAETLREQITRFGDTIPRR